MNFYQEWKDCLDNKLNDDKYMYQFLLNDSVSTDVFLNGEKEDIDFATDFIAGLPIEKFLIFIKQIDINGIGELTSSDVPQFSNFDKGTIEICKVLIANDGLDYKQIGGILCQTSKTDIAKQKFGENHSKLASYFNLVYFTKRDGHKVANVSNLGRLFNNYSCYKKDNLLRVLLIRQKLVLKIIYYLLNNNEVKLSKMCDFLSESTIKRRSSNIKYLINYILIGRYSKKYDNKIIL